MKKFLSKTLLFLFVVVVRTTCLAQSSVTGHVQLRDEGSAPGVSIMIKGSAKGTITDIDGNFKIEVPSEESILVFSFIGYEKKEEKVGSRSTLKVTLEPSTTDLKEVVVTAMGIESETKSLGYSVSSVDGEQISGSSETNVLNALSGRVAGLQITSSSGGVGSSSRMLLRGISSLGGNNQPLIVMDGVPVNNSSNSSSTVDWGSGINELNPQDIKEVTVLKGASAAALYGSRAANGAIVITTKSGSSKKGLGVEINSSLSLYRPLKLPDYQNDYGEGTSTTYYDYWRQGSSTSSFGPELDAGNYFVQLNSPMVRDSEGNILYGEDGIPIFQPTEMRSYENNVRDFFETGQTYTNSVSISQADENYNVRLSYTNMDQKGMIYNTDFSKNNFSLRGGVKIKDRLQINGNMQYNNGYSGNRNYMNNYAMNPVKSVLFMPRSTDINLLKNYKQLESQGIPLPNFVYPGEYTDVMSNSYDRTDYFPNPYYVLDNKALTYDFDRIFAVFSGTLYLTDWLKLDAKYSKEYIVRKYEDKSGDGVRNWTGSVWSYAGYYRSNNYKYDNTLSNVFLTANKQFGSFNVNAMLGGEQYSNIYESNGFYVPELTIPNLFNVDNAAGDVQTSNYFSEKRVHSAFGSVSVSYNDYLFLEITGRNDWSSTLPANNRSYFYPSLRLSAVVSEMMTLPTAINFVKLRASVTRVGNDTSPYQLNPTISNRNQIGGVYEATVENSLKNPTLKPEVSEAFEAGLELKLLDSRVSLDATYYMRSNKDQILSATVSPTSGYTSRLVNVGQIDNRGIEISGTIVPVVTSNFRWEIFGNYTRYKNEVVKLAPGVDQFNIGSGIYSASSKAIPGEPYGVIYGYGYQRDSEGNIIHLNGLPQATEELVPLGNVMPDWTGGIGTSVSYKGLSLSALFDVKMGGDMQSATVQWLRMNGLVEETNNADLRENGVVGKGVMNIGTTEEPIYVANNVSVTAADYAYGVNEYYLDESSIFDASYVKLREMKLVYNMPASVWGSLPLQKVVLGVTGRNLAILYSNVPHIDPETALNSGDSGQGWEVFNTPSARSINFSISVGF